MFFLHRIELISCLVLSSATFCIFCLGSNSLILAQQKTTENAKEEVTENKNHDPDDGAEDKGIAKAKRAAKLAVLAKADPGELSYSELELLFSGRSDDELVSYFQQNFASKPGVRPLRQGGFVAEVLEQRRAWAKAISIRKQVAKQAESLGEEHWASKLAKEHSLRVERITKLGGAERSKYLSLRQQALKLIDWSAKKPWDVDLKRAEWENISEQLGPFFESDPLLGIVVALQRIESVLAWGEKKEALLVQLDMLQKQISEKYGASPLLARSHAMTALALENLGRYEESMEHGKTSVRIYEQCETEKTDIRYCFAEFQLAGIHFVLGQVPQSHRLLGQIIKDCTDKSDLHRIVCYQCHNRLAANYRAMRDIVRSEFEVIKASTISETMVRRLAGNDPDKKADLVRGWMDGTGGFQELGIFALRHGLHQKAITQFYIDVDRKKKRNTNKEKLAMAYYHLALADVKIGTDLERAERSISRGLKVPLEWDDSFMFVEFLTLQTEIARKRNDMAEALKRLQQVNDFYRNHGNVPAQRWPLAIESLFATYDAQWKLKQKKDARTTNFEFLDRSFQYAVNQLPQLSSYGEQESLLNRLRRGMETLLSMADESDPKMVKQVLEWTSTVKGIGTESERQFLEQLQEWATTPKSLELIQELNRTRAKFVHILLHDSKRVRQRKADVQAILDKLEEVENNVLVELNQTFETRRLQQAKLPVDQLLAKIPAGTAYVDYWLTSEPQFWAEQEDLADARQLAAMLIWKPAENEPAKIRLVRLAKYSEVAKEVEQWRSLLANQGLFGLSDEQKEELDQKLLASSERLYSQVWEKLVPHIGEMEQVVVCPVESLWQVPFGALRNAKSKQFLVEAHEFSSVHSTRQFFDILSHPVQRPGSPVVIGGLEYGNTEAGEDEDETTFAFGPLKNSMDELESVSGGSRWDRPARRLHGAEATEASVAEAITNQENDMVHFATHAFARALDDEQLAKLNLLDEDDQDLEKRLKSALAKEPYVFAIGASLRQRKSSAFSGIALSGVNEVTLSDEDDQVLSAVEIETMDLSHLQFVVLSGCETGHGFVNRNEGVFGLQRSFYLAGVPSSLGSYWEVNDKETQETMERFYSHFHDQGKATALTLTQRELIKAGKPISEWAAWQLFGDWR